MQLLHVTFGKSRSVAWLRPIYLITVNLQYALLEKYGLAAIEGVFLWIADFLG